MEKRERILSEEVTKQLADVTGLFQKEIELAVIKGKDLEETSDMIQMAQEIGATNEKIKVKIYEENDEELIKKGIDLKLLPAIAILDNQGEFSRIKYTAVPTAHELNSFILAMYNVAGPGQRMGSKLLERMKNIDKKINMKIGISLNCTKCPDTVQSIQRIVIENKNLDVEIIDVFAHKDFKQRYDILNVPAIILNDKDMRFGQLSIEEVLDILEKY